MAEITNVRTQENNFFYEGLTGTDTTSQIKVNSTAGLVGTLVAVSGGGSGFNGGNITLQGSLDAATWFELDDLAGEPAVLTAAGFVEFSTGMCYVRAVAAAVGDVDITLRVAR